jgi:hypothetical protein
MNNIQNYDSFMKLIGSGVTVHRPDHYTNYGHIIRLHVLSTKLQNFFQINWVLFLHNHNHLIIATADMLHSVAIIIITTLSLLSL